MLTSRYKHRHAGGDMLSGEARAVIDAEFEEIKPEKKRFTFVQRWVKRCQSTLQQLKQRKA